MAVPDNLLPFTLSNPPTNIPHSECGLVAYEESAKKVLLEIQDHCPARFDRTGAGVKYQIDCGRWGGEEKGKGKWFVNR